MTDSIKKRVVDISNYIYTTKSTVRATAQIFNVSKSTVHNDIHFRLKKIDLKLYKEISKIMRINFDEKHIRGGKATKEKYKLKNKNIKYKLKK